MSIFDLENVAREYKEIQHLIKELESQADGLKQTMIKKLDADMVDEITAGAFIIRYKLVESSRIDQKILKAEFPDVAQLVTTSAVSTRFTVN